MPGYREDGCWVRLQDRHKLVNDHGIGRVQVIIVGGEQDLIVGRHRFGGGNTHFGPPVGFAGGPGLHSQVGFAEPLYAELG